MIFWWPEWSLMEVWTNWYWKFTRWFAYEGFTFPYQANYIMLEPYRMITYINFIALRINCIFFFFFKLQKSLKFYEIWDILLDIWVHHQTSTYITEEYNKDDNTSRYIEERCIKRKKCIREGYNHTDRFYPMNYIVTAQQLRKIAASLDEKASKEKPLFFPLRASNCLASQVWANS